jgi:hypothetical protein
MTTKPSTPTEIALTVPAIAELPEADPAVRETTTQEDRRTAHEAKGLQNADVLREAPEL